MTRDGETAARANFRSLAPQEYEWQTRITLLPGEIGRSDAAGVQISNAPAWPCVGELLRRA